MAIEQRELMQLSREDMSPVLGNMIQPEPRIQENGDIPVSEIGTANITDGGQFPSPDVFPIVLPNSPTFQVPANPLLPGEFSEILDYNSLQYLNGLFRTQIGRYVRVEQLVGSNTLQDQDGFLIGVGINYIILQDYATPNIRILDIYGIKQMYVYYTNINNPFTGDM